MYRQVVDILMGTYCASLVADLFLFRYERDFMLSLSDKNQAHVVEAINSATRYLDVLPIIIILISGSAVAQW